jgi:hypothetical protein
MSNTAISASFRDPSGFVFKCDGAIYRQVNQAYAQEYDRLMASGLYQDLAGAGLLIPHEEVDLPPPRPESAYRIIQPEPVWFVSYPYEWCFSQLRDAALSQLRIQKRAIHYGMTLKDCSAYNTQFYQGKPILIDSLSFERYREGEPWVAYRQFCQHFLAPLALMAYTDVRLSHLSQVYIDGIPLDLASRLLPARTWAVPSLLLHIHLHARSQERHAHKVSAESRTSRRFSRQAFAGLVDGLQSAVRRLSWRPEATAWASYYDKLQGYEVAAAEHKSRVVGDFVDEVRPTSVWDLGANTGLYSRIASQRGIKTVSFDKDAGCVEQSYLSGRKQEEKNLLPLVLDLTNPSPAIGWANDERMSLLERGPVDMVLALALLHHLAISNNVPFQWIAEFLCRTARAVVIEYIPKTDAQAQKLLADRIDVFDRYRVNAFEENFSQWFTIRRCVRLHNSERSLYLMVRKSE